MKRLIPAVIILVVIITSFFSSYYYIKDVCNNAYDGVENCLKEYNEHGTALSDAAWLKNYWDEKEKILSFFVNHEKIDEVELAISNLKLHSKFKDNYMFYEACDNVKILLHQIIEDTKLTTHSVF